MEILQDVFDSNKV